MSRRLSLPIFLLFGVVGLVGQQNSDKSAPPKRNVFQQALSPHKARPRVTEHLTPSSVKQLTTPSFGYYGEAACDGKGNLYFHADSGTPNEVSIFRLFDDGEKGALVQLPAEFVPKFIMTAFTVSPSGTLYVLVQSVEDHSYSVFAFNSDGKITSRTRLETPANLTTFDFAVFDDQVVLVKGYFNSNAEKYIQGKNYVALFENSGSLRRRLLSDMGTVNLSTESSSLPAGEVVLGDDGYAYILRERDILVMSETGEILRTIRFDPPTQEAVASRINVSQGTLSIAFTTTLKNHQVIRSFLIIRPDGTQRMYEAGPDLGNDVCYTNTDGIIFLKVDSKKSTLIRIAASAR